MENYKRFPYFFIESLHASELKRNFLDVGEASEKTLEIGLSQPVFRNVYTEPGQVTPGWQREVVLPESVAADQMDVLRLLQCGEVHQRVGEGGVALELLQAGHRAACGG